MAQLPEKAPWIRIIAIIQFIFICLSLCVCIALEVLWAIAISDLYAATSSGYGYSSSNGYGYGSNGYGYGSGYGGYSAMVKRATTYYGTNTLGGLHFTTFAAAFGLVTSIIMFWLNRTGRGHYIISLVYQGLNWVFFLTAFALATSYVSVIGNACMTVAGGPPNVGYAAVCALPMTVLAVDIIAWYTALSEGGIDGRLLFSITFAAEIWYAVRGRRTVVGPRYVDDEDKVANGRVQQQNGQYQNGRLRQ